MTWCVLLKIRKIEISFFRDMASIVPASTRAVVVCFVYISPATKHKMSSAHAIISGGPQPYSSYVDDPRLESQMIRTLLDALLLNHFHAILRSECRRPRLERFRYSA